MLTLTESELQFFCFETSVIVCRAASGPSGHSNRPAGPCHAASAASAATASPVTPAYISTCGLRERNEYI